MPENSPFNRVTLIVLDSAGIGEMPDAAQWGDAGSDTIGHILASREVHLPNLRALGLGNIRPRFPLILKASRPKLLTASLKRLACPEFLETFRLQAQR